MNSLTAISAAESLRPPSAETNRRLYRIGVIALVGGMVLATHRSKLDDVVLIAVGNIVMLLAALPALRWARTGALHFPTFEIFMLTAIPFYALSLLAGHPEVLTFPPEATYQAAIALLVFQGCALAAFFKVRARPAKSPMLTTTLLPEAAVQYAQLGLWLYTGYLYVNAFTDWIPHELRTPVRATFTGLGTVALFTEMRLWGAKQLRPDQKATVALNVFMQVVLLFRELYLISGISILLLALIGFVSTSRRVPVTIILVLLPAIGVLHNGKAAMRAQYWDGGAPAPKLAELPTYFEHWIELGLSTGPKDDMDTASLTGRLFDRASLFQMLCLVTDRTPEIEPFLAGESYKYVPAQIIPSFIWADKPSSLRSNVLLALHYGLVPEGNPTNVSIAFGMVAESYANFGLIGCAGLGLFLGFGYKRISSAAVGCGQFSAMGLLTILLAAWSFQVEQIFATWFVSLLQAGVVVIGLPMAFRIFFRQE